MQSQYRMGLHQRDDDGYEQEDYDEYEEEGSEEEEQEEDVKEAPPSREQQEFLKLREQLKEKFRQKLKKQTASAFGHQSRSQDRKQTTTTDRFGSFFGPSQPIIASRVIDESRSIRETQHITSRATSSSSGNIKGPASTSSEKMTYSSLQQPKPRVAINESKKKAQTLKDMRDYSFLLSDDADFPSPEEEPQQRPAHQNTSVPYSDGRTAHASSKTAAASRPRPPIGKPIRSAYSGHELKNSASKNMQSQTRVGPVKAAAASRPRPAPAEAKKVIGGNVTNGPGRPMGHKPLPSKVSAPSMGTSRPPARVMNDVNLKKKPSSADNVSLKKKPSPVNDISLKKKPLSAVPRSSTQKGQYSEQNRPSERPDKIKTVPKQPLPSSKPQLSKQNIHEDRLKKKPVKRRFDEDDDEDAIQMIRNMFGYNPNRYAGVDEDDSDMEADFSEIQKEERRSAIIAQKEDEEQLRLIEEEERRERMRMKKKQKLSRE